MQYRVSGLDMVLRDVALAFMILEYVRLSLAEYYDDHYDENFGFLRVSYNLGFLDWIWCFQDDVLTAFLYCGMRMNRDFYGS